MGAGNWTAWTNDIIEILRIIGLSTGDEFTLATVYGSEVILKRLHPITIISKPKSDNNFKSYKITNTYDL